MHKIARDKREADRIKTVIWFSDGWTQQKIAEALFIRPETIHNHLKDYYSQKKLMPENGGSSSKLTNEQTNELIAHLETNTYLTAKAICAYVEEKYKIQYTVAGMTKWLHEHKFSYKEPKPTPAKADPIKQDAFVKEYELLREACPKDESIWFLDGVHPTMALKVAAGWIRTGHDKLIPSGANKTRVNVLGALNLKTMTIFSKSYDTINGASVSDFLRELKAANPRDKKLHTILDRSSYNTSNEVKEAAALNAINLRYLPPYSPNLNPIERAWKVLNETTRNNVFFKSAKEFVAAINGFFDQTWPTIAPSMRTRVNDNFQRIEWASSG